MLELLGLTAALSAAGVGYVKSRDWVANRLRYVDSVHGPAAPIVAGVGATLIAAPIVAIVPIIGGGTALLFGCAVGFGTRAGVRRIRRSITPGY